MLAAAIVHVPLLLMKLPLHSYDATFHIFFASHYVHHWFDPWNAKWYAGFSQTTYPPLPQQWVAVLSHAFGLDMAYMAVQFATAWSSIIKGVGAIAGGPCSPPSTCRWRRRPRWCHARRPNGTLAAAKPSTQ